MLDNMNTLEREAIAYAVEDLEIKIQALIEERREKDGAKRGCLSKV